MTDTKPYNIPIALCTLDAGTPIQGKLRLLELAYCKELEVYHRRYWEAYQGGETIDTLVELPMHRRCVSAGGYVRFRGHVYEIKQAQFGEDSFGLPITTLSLGRSEQNLDISGISEPAGAGAPVLF